MNISFLGPSGGLSVGAAFALMYVLSCIYFAYLNADAARLETRRAAERGIGARARHRAAREAWRRTVRVMWSPLWPLVAIASIIIWLIEYNRLTSQKPDPPTKDLPPV